MRRELLVGCGSNWDKRVHPAAIPTEWENLTTLDINPDHKPDYVHDLLDFPYPFEDNTFDEVHAYETLEHLGTQGDYISFFKEFSEFWRILKPNGLFCATVPWWEGRWAWADPGHTRVITPDTLIFLSQQAYKDQVGVTMITDYRFCYSGDFVAVFGEKVETPDMEDAGHFVFALQAIKKEAPYEPETL